MDDDLSDNPTLTAGDETDDDPWAGLGARRGPRQPAEGVRIIGADEAAAAIESGQVTPKKPEDELRFGDVPPQPAGPRPSLRFPGADPAAVEKPPVAAEARPARDDRSAAALDAARRWEEALARSSAGRSVPRSTPPPPTGQDGGDDDLFAATRRRMSTPSDPPPPPTSPSPGRSAASAFGDWLGDDSDDLLDRDAPGRGAAGRDGGSAPSRTSEFDEPPYEPAYDPSKYESQPFESASMQHWTEPPSGEVPRILVGDDEEVGESDDLSAWSTLGAQPQWRDQPGDWEQADFNDAILADEGHRVGALRATQSDASPFSFDDEPEEADEAPAARPAPAGDRPPRVTPVGGRARISTLPSGGRGGPIGPGGVGSRGGDRSDLSTRVVTGAIAAGVLLVAAAIGPKALVFLVAVVLTMSVAELFQGLRMRGYHPATLLGLAATASLVGAAYWRDIDAYPLVLALFIVFTLLWYLTGVVRARPALNIAVTVMAFLYVGFLGSFAALILRINVPAIKAVPAVGGFPGVAGHKAVSGVAILVGAILATVAYDIGAYFVGRSLGKTPLAPEISPNKTVEGMVGATLVTLLVCLVIVSNIGAWDGGKAFWLAIVVSAAAPLGDLSESMIKRDLGVKDMGNILPGHGGVLDRIDALLFVIPATYALVRILFF